MVLNCMNNLKPALLTGLFLLSQLVASQQQYYYKRGSVQLPNADRKSGSILMPVTKPDSLDFLYFREGEYGYPVKYYADEIISAEIFEGSRRFISVLLPGDTGMERRIAELHFSGEHLLISVLQRSGELYYITDLSGNIAKLENTYDPPSAMNGFQLTYNYEYRSILSSWFGDDTDIQNSIADLKYRQKDMTSFLKNYHIARELPYNQYPPPLTNGFVGVTGGLSIISNVNPIDDSKDYSTVVASMGLFGQFDSFSGPFFVRAGISGYRGRLYYDSQYNTAFSQIVFTEEEIELSIVSLNLNLGFDLFTKGNFTPFLSSGIGYYGYTQFKNSKVTETLNILHDVVIVTLSEEDERPVGFAGIILEAGTSYSLKTGSRIQLGASFGHFLNKGGYMKNGTGLTISYYHKLF